MKKTVTIDGMMCEHCANAVKKALESLPATDNVKVSVKHKTAIFSTEADDETIKEAVFDAGYTVVSIN